MKKVLIVALSLLVSGASLVAFGGGSKFGFGHHRGNSAVSIIKQLDLSDEQKTKLRDIRVKAKEDRKYFIEEAKAQYKSSRFIAFSNNTFDRDLLVKNFISKAATKANKKADKIEQLLAILTPSQKKKFYAKIEEIQEDN